MAKQSDTKPGKKLYIRPVLKEFGEIKLTTRGSGTVNGDGGMGMMAAM